jgi:methylaspartate mutase sigma subunit
MKKKQYRIVMGVIGHDIHVVSNRIIEIALKDSNYQVCNIGVDNDANDFLDAVIEFEAHAVIVSSLNGEADYWCKDFGKIFDSSKKENVIKYLGGNLVIGDVSADLVEMNFIKYGFNKVFHRPSNIDILLTNLSKDLK